MGFIQTTSYRTTRPDEIQALAEKFNRDNPDAPGLIGTKVLKDRDRDVQVQAAYALAEFGPAAAAAVPALKEILKGRDGNFRLAAVHALSKIEGKK